MDKPFVGINVSRGRIDLTDHENILLMRPIVIYLKEDGDKDDNPSFAILMQKRIPFSICAVGEISLRMWNEGLADVGYKIVKI